MVDFYFQIGHKYTNKSKGYEHRLFEKSEGPELIKKRPIDLLIDYAAVDVSFTGLSRGHVEVPLDS